MALGIGGTVVAKARTVLEGDTRDLDRALTQSEKRFGSWQGKATAAGAAVGAAIVYGAKRATDAAKEAETATGRQVQQLESLGIEHGKYAKKIDATIKKQSDLFAIDDEDLSDVFTNLVRATGDVDKALGSTALAADVARGKQISLEAATQVVTKAHMGQAGALRRMGIDVDKNATKVELLAELQEKFGGQARAYGESAAAASDRQAVAAENLSESYGKSLLPTLSAVQGALTGVFGWMERHQTAANVLIGTTAALAAGTLAVAAATKVYTAVQTISTAATAASSPALMAYRAQLWAVAATTGTVTTGTKVLTAAQVALTKTPLGIVLASTAIALGAIAGSSALATDEIREQADAARSAADANAEWAANLQSVRDQQAALAGKRLGVKESKLGVDQATVRLDQVRADPKFVKGSLEERGAMLALVRARQQHVEAVRAEADAFKTNRADNAKAVTQARAAASELSRLGQAKRELAEATRAERAIYAYGGTKEERDAAKERLRIATANYETLEAAASGHVETLAEIQRTGLVDVVQIGDQYQVVTRRNGESTAGIMEATARDGRRRANREIAKTGHVKLDRDTIVENLVTPFEGIGKQITDQIGAITVDIKGILKLSGGVGDGAGVGAISGVDSLTPLANRSGLIVTSGHRPGDDGYHGSNRARDYGGSAGEMKTFAMLAMSVYGANLKELIYSPLGIGIKNGQRVNIRGFYGDAVYRDHFDHVHVAMQRGGRVPWMPWSPHSGDSTPAMLEPDEVVVNRNYTRSYPGGPSAFDRDTNGAIPRFASGGFVGSVSTGKAAAQRREAAAARRANALAAAAAERERAEAETERRQAESARQSEAALARAQQDAAALRSSVTRALSGRVFEDEMSTLRARVGTTGDQIAALDRTRGTNDARIAMTSSALGQAVDWETRNDLQDQLNNAIQRQLELDQQRNALIQQQNEERQREISTSVQTRYAMTDAQRDLLTARAEATATLDDDKALLAEEIASWAAKVADLQASQQIADATEATRLDLIKQEADATRSLTAAQKRQSEMANEMENQIQERLRAERDAILAARSQFLSEFASNTFSPAAGGGYVNGPTPPLHLEQNMYFHETPDDPWGWTKKTQGAAESVFGG